MNLGSVIIFWASLIAIPVLLIGLIRKKTYWLSLGCVLTLPFTLYLSLAPRFGISMFLLTLSQVAAIISMRKGIIWLFWLLVLPYPIFYIWLMKELHFL